MRCLSVAAVISFAVGAVSLALTMTGCDQLNKPIGNTSSSSSSSSGSTTSSRSDAGDGSGEGGAPAPTVTAQPGDISL